VELLQATVFSNNEQINKLLRIIELKEERVREIESQLTGKNKIQGKG